MRTRVTQHDAALQAEAKNLIGGHGVSGRFGALSQSHLPAGRTSVRPVIDAIEPLAVGALDCHDALFLYRLQVAGRLRRFRAQRRQPGIGLAADGFAACFRLGELPRQARLGGGDARLQALAASGVATANSALRSAWSFFRASMLRCAWDSVS